MIICQPPCHSEMQMSHLKEWLGDRCDTEDEASPKDTHNSYLFAIPAALCIRSSSLLKHPGDNAKWSKYLGAPTGVPGSCLQSGSYLAVVRALRKGTTNR